MCQRQVSAGPIHLLATFDDQPALRIAFGKMVVQPLLCIPLKRVTIDFQSLETAPVQMSRVGVEYQADFMAMAPHPKTPFIVGGQTRRELRVQNALAGQRLPSQ